MENTIGVLIILIIILSILLIIAIAWLLCWKRKHDEAIKAWCTESDSKDEQIIKLEEELKIYKDMGRVIKVEKVVMQPKEFEIKYALHGNFIDDSEMFKKVCLREVARYMAEELEKDPYLYTMCFEQSPIKFHEFVRIKFRLLPYSEGVTWNDIFKEEKNERNGM